MSKYLLTPIWLCIHFIKNNFNKILFLNSAICRLEEIDHLNKFFVIHTRGIATPIKIHFKEIINDTVLISSLNSEQASWVGYYIGKYYPSLKVNDGYFRNKNGFSFESTTARYSLISKCRNSNITYLDRVMNKAYETTLMDILTKRQIQHFVPLEAFYLGMLAGLKVSADNERKNKSSLKKINLKLVV